MPIKKKLLIFLTVFILILLLILQLVKLNRSSEKEVVKEIALIVYGKDSDRWENLRQGAELVCEDNNAELSLITMSSENDYNEQIALIDREIENGIDGILLVPCDSKKIGEYLDELNVNIPIVLLENNVISDKQYTCISANDYELGQSLGEAIVDRENLIIKAAIISDGMNRDNNVKREQGVRSVIEGYANKVVAWERNDNEKNLNTQIFIQRKLAEDAVDVIIALDNETSDALMDALDNLNKTSKVYVISTSNKSVYNLDLKKIKAIEYQTEYGIGYIGAYSIFDSKYAQKHFNDKSIQYEIVDRKNMYDNDNQMLLFPFVK